MSVGTEQVSTSDARDLDLMIQFIRSAVRRSDEREDRTEYEADRRETPDWIAEPARAAAPQG